MSSTNDVALSLTRRRDLFYVPALAQGTNPVSMLLDTGFEMTMIHPARAEEWDLAPSGRVTIAGIAGRERADTFNTLDFFLGALRFQPEEVAALPSDRRRRRDGIFGSDFFRRFVVELDVAQGEIRLSEPASYHYRGTGEIIPLRFPKTTPVLELVFEDTSNRLVVAQVEIDTGCDGALCLGSAFLQEHPTLRQQKPSQTGRRGGVGGGADVETGPLPGVRLGKLRIDQPIANFFIEGSPAGRGLAGHAGIELLRDFRVILDYTRHRMILEKPPR